MVNRLYQPQILGPLPAVARSIAFRVLPGSDIKGALRRLSERFGPEMGVVGIGEPTVRALGQSISGLRTFPAFSGPGCGVPSTQRALWMLIGGADRGIVFDAACALRDCLDEAFVPEDIMDTFTYHGGRDLTRFEDGTENPKGDAARRTAIVGEGALQGSSFVAVQRWIHDLKRFHRFPSARRDEIIGRSAETNEELSEAPASAHVKRAAQESYTPAAFMLRRSMPWAAADRQGLEFIAFGETLDRYERVMRRMVGLDDGTVDGLFEFSHPITGGYYWCPPMVGERLDFSALGL